MNPFASLLSTTAPVSGNFAGWMLTFHKAEGSKIGAEGLSLNSDQYDADLAATLETGLRGGAFTFVIEGLSDADYKKLLGLQAARLHLYWRDTSSLPGALLSTAGLTSLLPKPKMSSGGDDPTLIAELALRPRIMRRTGARQYEAVIEAEQWVLHQLKTQRVTAKMLTSLQTTSALDAVKALVKGIVPVEVYPHPAFASGKSQLANSLRVDQTLLEALAKLGELMQAALPVMGHDLYVIRRGTLHAGFRPIPLPAAGKVKELSAEAGLVAAERIEVGDDTAHKPHSFRLTLRGYADLQPGDVVSFDPPSEEPVIESSPKGGIFADILNASPLGGITGAAKAKPALLAVTQIEQRQGRTAGFFTQVNGIIVNGTDKQAWLPVPEARPDAPITISTPATNVDRAAQSLRSAIDDAMHDSQRTEIGEVRKLTTQGSAEPPAQTLDIYRGLENGDGKVNGARRLAIRRKNPSPVQGVPYATPFAWGPCGLVIPYYVGTRVVMAHRGGQAEDPVVTGALWESGKGPNSKAGDWWLGLPVGVPESRRASIPDGDTPTIPTDLKAANDLTDAEGRRIIEVGEFIIRVGKQALHPAGTRPERKSAQNESITIEHLDGGCLITLKADGTIVLKGKKVEIEAADTISMKATSVNIAVTKAVNIT